jgi:BSD domain
MNFSVFRDFPGDQATQAPGALNAWQARHAALVVANVKEVDELRFVLCPRYMDDERFWAVYFSLVRKQLPDKAYSWPEGEELPFAAAAAACAGPETDMFTGIGSQLQLLGRKIQQATAQRTITQNFGFYARVCQS